MNTPTIPKNRLEGLSDATSAIVLTLLVIQIHVPELSDPDFYSLMHGFFALWPPCVGYFVSFAVLAMFWMSHNFLYSISAKNINRQLVFLNLLFLCLIALVPFFSHLIGRYWEEPFAVALYGSHILLIALTHSVITAYAYYSNEIETEHVPSRIRKQGMVRSGVTIVSTMLGIGAAFVFIPLALFLFALPIVFNVIPGLLNRAERLFGFTLS
mgnify:CR=1 FL=1